jgi:hypothetical protein
MIVIIMSAAPRRIATLTYVIMDTRERDIDMEITEEELEEIKERSYNLGAINAILDNCLVLVKELNNSLDKSSEKLNEFNKRAEEVNGLEGINS